MHNLTQKIFAFKSKPVVYFILISLMKLAKLNALDPQLPRAKCKTNYVIN